MAPHTLDNLFNTFISKFTLKKSDSYFSNFFFFTSFLYQYCLHQFDNNTRVYIKAHQTGLAKSEIKMKDRNVVAEKKFQLFNGNFKYYSRKFVPYCCDGQVNFYKSTLVYKPYSEVLL